MSELVKEIASTIRNGFHPLTIVYNPDGFLADPVVSQELARLCECEVKVGTPISLRVHYELHLRREQGKKAIYIVTSGEMLPDILINANVVNFKITELFPNYSDKETISKLGYDMLAKLFDKHIQGLVSATRLQTLINAIKGELVAEPASDFGEAIQRFNALENPDWSDVNTIKEICDLFVQVVNADKYDEIAEHLDDLNFDFQHYLAETYGNSLNASPLLRPRTVKAIVPHIKDNFCKDDKVALVVVDGMAFWQYSILLSALAESKICPQNEDWIYSWIPSITSLARQAIFRGDAPLIEGYSQSPQSERTLWRSHWDFAQFSPQYFCDSDNFSVDSFCRRLAVVTVELDEKMHSSSSYLDLLALTRIWAKSFARKIADIKDAGYTLFLTTDHGNLLADGWRPFSSTEKAHLYGKISRGHRHAIFMNKDAADAFEASAGYSIRLRRDGNSFAIADNKSFTSNGATEITHGGTHFFEVMIPFIRF